MLLMQNNSTNQNLQNSIFCQNKDKLYEIDNSVKKDPIPDNKKTIKKKLNILGTRRFLKVKDEEIINHLRTLNSIFQKEIFNEKQDVPKKLIKYKGILNRKAKIPKYKKTFTKYYF